VPLFRRADQIDERREDATDRSIGLSNFGDTLLAIGALREAVGAVRQALILNRKLEDYREGARLRALGHALSSTGDQALAYIALSRGRRFFMEQGQPQGEGLVAAYLAELALWLGDFLQARNWAEQAWELAAVERHERDFTRAALLQGRVALGDDDLPRADERLHHALTRARAVNVVEFELSALIAIAELELRRGRPAKAKVSLEDVWEAAERGPYPLYQADAFNALAAIESAEGNKQAAIGAAASAFKAAWCDGPPYAYHWGLEKAKAHLAALGVLEPVLPLFDESKFEPMPEVEINPKDKYWVDPDSLD
jgi:ATP/maltotriose-dependent transcriptional regulator MalT